MTSPPALPPQQQPTGKCPIALISLQGSRRTGPTDTFHVAEVRLVDVRELQNPLLLGLYLLTRARAELRTERFSCTLSVGVRQERHVASSLCASVAHFASAAVEDWMLTSCQCKNSSTCSGAGLCFGCKPTKQGSVSISCAFLTRNGCRCVSTYR